MKAKESSRRVLHAAGAGRWFPGDRAELDSMVEGYLNAARVERPAGRMAAAVAPHAGYMYSGAVAGYTYRALRDAARAGDVPEVVVVLGFSHRGRFPGVALMDGDAVVTPLGEAALDTQGRELLVEERPALWVDSRPHQGEHSAENQIPFLQKALPDVPLIIGIMGDAGIVTQQGLLEGLMALSETRRVLVVASTDLLHDPDYEKVTRTDRETLRQMTALDTAGLLKRWQPEEQVCCGLGPVLAAMEYARRQGGQAGTLLHYRNSGDDFPESRGQWVVGYGAMIFTLLQPPSSHNRNLLP